MHEEATPILYTFLQGESGASPVICLPRFGPVSAASVPQPSPPSFAQIAQEMVSRKHSPSMASYGAAAAGLEKAAKGHKALNLLERRGATSGLSDRKREHG